MDFCMIAYENRVRVMEKLRAAVFEHLWDNNNQYTQQAVSHCATI
jgi:hypothetical protein